LQMADTSYNVPEAKWLRVALPVALPTGALPRTQDTHQITGHFQGNTGLVSSAPDYLSFTMMLLGRGALNGVRVLGGGTVDLMRVDALGSIPHDTESGTSLLGPGYGFGARLLRPNSGRRERVSRNQGLLRLGRCVWHAICGRSRARHGGGAYDQPD